MHIQTNYSYILEIMYHLNQCYYRYLICQVNIPISKWANKPISLIIIDYKYFKSIKVNY